MGKQRLEGQKLERVGSWEAGRMVQTGAIYQGSLDSQAGDHGPHLEGSVAENPLRHV